MCVRKTAAGIVPVVLLDRRSRAPLYRQLYEGFRDAILERRLRAGQRIPSTRSLARDLQISRLPLLNAYEQLTAEGYLRSRTGSGTFVASVPSKSRSSARAPMAVRGKRPVSRDTDFLLSGETSPWLG